MSEESKNLIITSTNWDNLKRVISEMNKEDKEAFSIMLDSYRKVNNG